MNSEDNENDKNIISVEPDISNNIENQIEEKIENNTEFEMEKNTEKSIENIEENYEQSDEQNYEENDEQNDDKNQEVLEERRHRNYPTVKEKSKKILKISLIALVLVIVNFIILFGIICIINRFNDKVYKNVFIFGQDISNYSIEQVETLLKEKSKKINEIFNIDVYQGDKDIYNIKAEDIDYAIDIEKTSNKIMSFGRKDNFLIDNMKILKALIFKVEILPECMYSDEKIDDVTKNIELTIDNRYTNDTYKIDETKKTLTITRGKTGNSLDFEKVRQDIIAILNGFKSANYNVSLLSKKPTELNLEEIYSSVKREAKDAYINMSVSPPEFVSEKCGYDLDVAKLTEFLNKDENKNEGISIDYPLTIIEPKVKLADISYTLYNDKLAGYTTYFDSSQTARANNLSVALRYLNGVIVMPGEIFSYYDKIGETSYSKGYQDAATFKAGTVVYEVGGGICQTSSTLYNVALMANLEIVERHQHGLPVGYVPPSRDATVYGNVLNFKFKNTRNYPIKIVTSFSPSGNMNISLYGTKEKQEYEVVLSSKILYYIPFTTKYTYDQNINSGISSVITNGTNGYASEAYITKKLNGAVVSSTVLSKDVYKAKQAEVKVGTKGNN